MVSPNIKDVLEIEKSFFDECRKIHQKTSENFFLIKDWDAKNIKRIDERDYRIKLSFQITQSGREQLLLNRHKKGNATPDKGVVIPISVSPYIGQCMQKQIGENGYQKGSCDSKDIGKKDAYTFELIQSFPLEDSNDTINFKLMHNSKETKYFLNNQFDPSATGNKSGVEIPKTMLEQVGRYLIQCPQMITKSKGK